MMYPRPPTPPGQSPTDIFVFFLGYFTVSVSRNLSPSAYTTTPLTQHNSAPFFLQRNSLEALINADHSGAPIPLPPSLRSVYRLSPLTPFGFFSPMVSARLYFGDFPLLGFFGGPSPQHSPLLPARMHRTPGSSQGGTWRRE